MNKDNINSEKSQQQLVAESTFSDYTATFVQRIPKYALKTKNREGEWGKWRTRNSSLGDGLIHKHLQGGLAVAVLGQYYPRYAILDIDHRDLVFVEDVRAQLGMDESNSMVCTSQDKNSYHITFRPFYNQKPPTLRLLNEVFQPFCRVHGIENIYPRPNKCIRLPFSTLQNILAVDSGIFYGEEKVWGVEYDQTWEQKLYQFEKLDEKEISEVPLTQTYLPLDLPDNQRVPAWKEGKELLEIGLQAPSTRHEAQFKILLYLWRKNTPPETAREIVWKWIRKRHNGFSKDILNHPTAVKKEIQRQTAHIWGKYTSYPDQPHNTHYGYLTKPDIYDIFMISGGSLPKSRFLFHLVKFCYPRRMRDRINVHSDHFKMWSDRRTYTKRLRGLSEKGVIKRWDNYYAGENDQSGFSKPLKLNWKYRSISDAILVDNRAPNTIEGTVKATFEVDEIRELLKKSGMDEGNISRYLSEIFG